MMKKKNILIIALIIITFNNAYDQSQIGEENIVVNDNYKDKLLCKKTERYTYILKTNKKCLDNIKYLCYYTEKIRDNFYYYEAHF